LALIAADAHGLKTAKRFNFLDSRFRGNDREGTGLKSLLPKYENTFFAPNFEL